MRLDSRETLSGAAGLVEKDRPPGLSAVPASILYIVLYRRKATSLFKNNYPYPLCTAGDRCTNSTFGTCDVKCSTVVPGACNEDNTECNTTACDTDYNPVTPQLLSEHSMICFFEMYMMLESCKRFSHVVDLCSHDSELQTCEGYPLCIGRGNVANYHLAPGIRRDRNKFCF